jgi:ATP-dependent DNA helicase PIF1
LINTRSLLDAEYLRETTYDAKELASCVNENESRMTAEQRNVYSLILDSVNNQKGGLFFLDAPGGTGKTFLLNTLLAKIRQKGCIALAVASSGIAATLLEGGRTAHSAFKLPLDLGRREDPTCNISRGSAKAKILRDCQLIIWDEATMSHKGAFEALDRTIQDIKRNNRVMGGMTVLLAGDFRQTLPVIQRGSRADEVKACLKSSHLDME